ncbi:MAG: hypothetical protein ILO36_04865 [Abditibacteriota bacterium]|nr:hypothetical protein [Abditibacteriota bacterium]
MPSTPGATAAAAAPAAPAAPAAETKEKKPAPALPTLAHGSASKDDNGEVRVYNAFPEYTGRSSSRPYGADENECREAALAFVRAYYYEFDSMSFQYRNVPGKWLGNRWRYTFTQIIRDTKRTGNTITIDVNPDYYDAENDMHYPEVVYYKAVKKNWTN